MSRREEPAPFLTPAELGLRLKVSSQTVLNKVHSGEWECTKLSDRIYRFTEDQYEAIAAGIGHRKRPSNRKRMHAALKAIS